MARPKRDQHRVVTCFLKAEIQAKITFHTMLYKGIYMHALGKWIRDYHFM